MKHIIINLSPRVNGTSSMLVRYFRERLTKSETESVNLYDYLGAGKEKRELLEKIKASDS